MKKIYLTESQLRAIIKRTIEEQSFFKDGRNPLSRIGDFFGGLKGTYKGEGFKYGEHSTALSRFLNRLKKLDVPNEEVMRHLDMLLTRIKNSSMTQERKAALVRMITNVKKEFGDYQDELDTTINKIKSGNIQPPVQPPVQQTQPNTTP